MNARAEFPHEVHVYADHTVFQMDEATYEAMCDRIDTLTAQALTTKEVEYVLSSLRYMADLLGPESFAGSICAKLAGLGAAP